MKPNLLININAWVQLRPLVTYEGVTKYLALLSPYLFGSLEGPKVSLGKVASHLVT